MKLQFDQTNSMSSDGDINVIALTTNQASRTNRPSNRWAGVPLLPSDLIVGFFMVDTLTLKTNNDTGPKPKFNVGWLLHKMRIRPQNCIWDIVVDYV
jgi:hypothetical protein